MTNRHPKRSRTAKVFSQTTVLLALATFALAAVAAAPVIRSAGFADAPGQQKFKDAPGQQKRNFTISGELTTTLAPGASAPLDLTFGNPNQQTLQIEELVVTVADTSDVACDPDNFDTVNYSGGYPIAIPRGTSQLSDVVTDSTKWPSVAMINKTTNQDACKGVNIELTYSGVASK